MSKFESYGKLSHYNLEDLNPGGGERKASFEGKKNPGDFALWKFKKEGELSGVALGRRKTRLAH